MRIVIFGSSRSAWLGVTLLVLLSCELPLGSESGLSSVKETSLLSLAKQKKRLLVFAYSGDCEDCSHQRQVLRDVKEQSEGVIDGLHVIESQVQSTASWTGGEFIQGPALLYFRAGSPIIYDGVADWDSDTLGMWLTTNQDSMVLSLDDETFEHDTQAATGATTGHWMVMFSEKECEACDRMKSVWDDAASRLHGQVLFAQVDLDRSPGLKKRFSIASPPAFLYFRQGHQYELPIYDQGLQVTELVSFAVSGFKKVVGEKVTLPADEGAELYQHVAMLVAVLFPFGIIGLLLQKSPQKRQPSEDDEEEEELQNGEDINLDVPRTHTLEPLTKQRTSTTPVRRRPSTSRSKSGTD